MFKKEKEEETNLDRGAQLALLFSCTLTVCGIVMCSCNSNCCIGTGLLLLILVIVILAVDWLKKSTTKKSPTPRLDFWELY